jgi:inner membrane protein
VRYRGIYEVVLYSSVLRMKGTFALPKMSEHGIAPENLLWKDAFVTVGVSDLKGIKNSIVMKWDGTRFSAEPGVKTTEIVKSGFTIQPQLDPSKNRYDFALDIGLDGSGEFDLVPAGSETHLTLDSSWKNPSFTGNFLPERREITKDGFRATWNIQQLNRNFPQSWTGRAYSMEGTEFGVKLHLPVDEYQKVTRSVKYALMFIALTFLAFFLTEVFSGRPIHPVQYALIGLAVVLFYVILLSLTEHVTFDLSYLLASLGTILLIAGYAKGIFRAWRATLLIGSVLTALYAFLFVTLQMEDYALILGSIGLFVILAIVMYLTRGVNWFASWENRTEEKAP